MGIIIPIPIKVMIIKLTSNHGLLSLGLYGILYPPTDTVKV